MIISRTPYRISFFGGGTDYPAWYKSHGGAVLSSTIDKYCYIATRYLPPFFENKYRVVYSRIELKKSIEEIEHPAVREALKYLNISNGLEVHHQGDLPARSGMGSSSAFMVGLLHTLYALKGKMISKEHLAKESIFIEQEVIKENIGSQDQVATAYGGINQILFHQNGEISVVPVPLISERIEELNSSLMLFYTGIIRTASDIAGSFINSIEDKKRQLRVMKDLVDESISILTGKFPINDFGLLLNETWQMKQNLSGKITNPEVNNIYNTALQAGATGGKLLGAGGGGFMLIFAPPEKQKAVKDALNQLIHVPFNFEFSGSQIVFFSNEKDYSKEAIERETQIIQNFQELV